MANRSMPKGLKILQGRGMGRDGVPRDAGGRPVAPGVAFHRYAPDKPDDLSPDAAAFWDLVVPELARLELIKPEDAGALVALCEAFADLKESRRLVRKHGPTAHTADGRPVSSPWVAQRNASSREFRAWCCEFGLTPASESRVDRPADDAGGAGPSVFA